ncbi:MAG: thiamine-phosphate kinase [Alistipes sp.]|nr:thiamine-phosphate kinase [Alistipes sp.]
MTEFGFIESLRNLFATLPSNGFEGIGDDCAVYGLGNDEALLFTSDTLNEGVHFLRTEATPEQVGAKSLMVNLSDIAAMGARPIATLLALSLPADCPEGWAESFIEGYRSVAERYGVPLVGGDTTSSLRGITINVTAIGRAPESHIKRRSAARSGDVIFVGGVLGGSALGLRNILDGDGDTAAAHLHHAPQAQVAEGEWLGAQPCVHAMMDLSDGLASDLRHILVASKVGAVVNVEQIPIYEGATIRDAVGGGEDYMLLFTVERSGVEAMRRQFAERFGYEPYAIGEITESPQPEIEWREKGKTFYPDWRGFSHF